MNYGRINNNTADEFKKKKPTHTENAKRNQLTTTEYCESVKRKTSREAARCRNRGKGVKKDC